MEKDDWEPFGLTDEERHERAVLRRDVPPLMREALLDWVTDRLAYAKDRKWWRHRQCLDLQNTCGVSLGVVATSTSVIGAERPRNVLRERSDIELLRVVDYLVSGLYVHGEDAKRLNDVLDRSRSAWVVGTRLGKLGLVERVPSGVQDAVEAVIASGDAAGRLLARAWVDVHGIEEKDSSGYAYAVRAVETAAIQVVTPRKRDATLGHVLGQMRADGDWRLPLREDSRAPSAEVLLGMLGTLWFGHRDRHGSANYSDVSHDEARAAVALAATLVDWFSSGAVRRRSA